MSLHANPSLRIDRQLGRHYTPHDLARRMVAGSLDALAFRNGRPLPRVLDPACGEGAFLLPLFDELLIDNLVPLRSRRAKARIETSTPSARLGIVRSCIFGVDLDEQAVGRLRDALHERIGATGSLAKTARAATEANIRIGDALTGEGFTDATVAARRIRMDFNSELDPVAMNWGRAFPEVARAGGFDLVIGNPPYVRERDAQPLFERLAATNLGRKWHQARMDLWYYFVHRSLDLLRTGGILSFVVNSYWTASKGASRLIERLRHETRFEEIELLGDQPLFDGVSGRHMVFRARKVIGAPECLAPLPRDPLAAKPHPTLCRILSTVPLRSAPARQAKGRSASSRHEFSIAHADLFQGGRIVPSPPDRLQACLRQTGPLGESFETRQGIAENPPTINRRHVREFGDRYTLGEGVFVLRADEVDRLALTDIEHQLLRPYFDTVAIERYRAPEMAMQQVLYLTRTTAPTLDRLPNIARHLSRFRPILERRRETRLGKCAWWHLHWPRDERIFLLPRILSVQMGRRPQFAFADDPTFVGFSINLILPATKTTHSLPALTGILNSALAGEWFERHAKRRGVHLEINAHVLRDFPVPLPNLSLDKKLAALVGQRQKQPYDSEAAARFERDIERLVEKWYGLSTMG
ncbi:MAG: hypothetical protein EXS05_24045 [Planctomycetaceae bacterium]|nr:hypothetical protein [Planctomycetaceae bacterium]